MSDIKEIPIDPKQLVELKKAFVTVSQVAESAKVLEFAKALANLVDVGNQVISAEEKVNEVVGRIALTHGVSAESYAGLDLERGMIKVKRVGTAVGLP